MRHRERVAWLEPELLGGTRVSVLHPTLCFGALLSAQSGGPDPSLRTLLVERKQGAGRAAQSSPWARGRERGWS
jgi:hypothetical protein